MSANEDEDVHAAMRRDADRAIAGADQARGETAHRRKWAYVQEATLEERMADPDRDWGPAGVPEALEEAARRSFSGAGPEAEVRRGSKPGLEPERPMYAVWIDPPRPGGRCKVLSGDHAGHVGVVASVVAGPGKDQVRLRFPGVRVPTEAPDPRPTKPLELVLPLGAVQSLPSCDPEF